MVPPTFRADGRGVERTGTSLAFLHVEIPAARVYQPMFRYLHLHYKIWRFTIVEEQPAEEAPERGRNTPCLTGHDCADSKMGEKSA